MHLARTVEHTVDVDGMLSRMEPAQFEEWIALYQLEPWGADWQQAAVIAAKIHNAFLGEPITPADIIPSIDNQRTTEIPEEQLGATWRARLKM